MSLSPHVWPLQKTDALQLSPAGCFFQISTLGTIEYAICAFQILVTCLAIMVILTIACTCQFTMAGILPMSKLVTHEALQGVQNISVQTLL